MIQLTPHATSGTEPAQTDVQTRTEGRMTDVKDPDEQKGAVEGNRPFDGGQGNPNAPGLDDTGMPNDPVAIAAGCRGRQ